MSDHVGRNTQVAPGQRNPEGGQRFFRPGGARPPIQILKAFVDQYRDTFGVEPICKVLQIAPSGYRRHAAQFRDAFKRSARARRDEALQPEIKRVWESNMQVYLAETTNGLYKAELIHRRAPWKTKQSVEVATLEWVAWYNHHRLMEPLGYIPPAEAEANYYKQLKTAIAEAALT